MKDKERKEYFKELMATARPKTFHLIDDFFKQEEWILDKLKQL